MSSSSSSSSGAVKIGGSVGGGVFLMCVECRLEWKDPQQCSDYGGNVSLMVTGDRIALISGDPRWLLSRQIHFRTWGIALLSLQLVINLISLVPLLLLLLLITTSHGRHPWGGQGKCPSYFLIYIIFNFIKLKYRVAEWLALRTTKFGNPGSNPAVVKTFLQ